MADVSGSQSALEISLPRAGEVVEYQMTSDIPVKLNFYVTEVVFSCDGTDLIFTGDQGGTVVIKDYLSLAQADALPAFELKGGEEVPGDIYLFAFNGEEQAVETAAGGNLDDASGASGADILSPDEWLEPLLAPDAGEDISSSLEILTPEQLFSGEEMVIGCDDVGSASLVGAVTVPINHEMPLGSLADGYDAVNECVQHIIDSPEYS
ncbi:hypothetical protein GO013_05935 [Pseudodesulfovibrio sp. JC047]|uniref:hypothetical protein n=1 Tax=Pseudodesulfovibrio sp. JC047 TaxID=2683199 RepID=UPI0013D1E674|nr:hypothetical protein [Pseudodesulfovibrio sp. JC047]NDV18959.1 hypothetical protein [Pseudodesulfovibrio sp. JC047]